MKSTLLSIFLSFIFLSSFLLPRVFLVFLLVSRSPLLLLATD